MVDASHHAASQHPSRNNIAGQSQVLNTQVNELPVVPIAISCVRDPTWPLNQLESSSNRGRPGLARCSGKITSPGDTGGVVAITFAVCLSLGFLVCKLHECDGLPIGSFAYNVTLLNL